MDEEKLRNKNGEEKDTRSITSQKSTDLMVQVNSMRTSYRNILPSAKLMDFVAEHKRITENIRSITATPKIFDVMAEQSKKMAEVRNIVSNQKILKVLSEHSRMMENIRKVTSTPKFVHSINEHNRRMFEVQEALKLPKFTEKWILAPPVLKQISPNISENKFKEILNKLPKSNYNLNAIYNKDNEELEYVLENKETTDTIPVHDVHSAVGLTDIIKALTIENVFDFYNHLVKYPMLGLEHPVGKIIFDELKNVKLYTYENIILHRVRARDKNERTLPYSESEMFNAPYGLAGHGRFNVIGQGELYLCSSSDVALKEIATEDKNILYDLVKWELVNPVELLDLSRYSSPLVQYSSYKKMSDNNNEYLIPNFLSQCIKFHEITGISYKSVRGKDEINYVLFDFEHKWFRLVEHYPDLEYNSE